jgi:hypothetical protein
MQPMGDMGLGALGGTLQRRNMRAGRGKVGVEGGGLGCVRRRLALRGVRVHGRIYGFVVHRRPDLCCNKTCHHPRMGWAPGRQCNRRGGQGGKKPSVLREMAGRIKYLPAVFHKKMSNLSRCGLHLHDVKPPMCSRKSESCSLF